MKSINLDDMQKVEGGVTTMEVAGAVLCGAALVSGYGALIFGPSCAGMLLANWFA